MAVGRDSPGPVDRPRRNVRFPQHQNDILVGEYFYGIECPHCKKTTPIIQNINDNMVGGRIDKYAMDKLYDYSRIRNEQIGDQLSPNARSSLGKGGVEATPTFVWADGCKTEGGPFRDDEFATVEAAEYLCIRAAKCFVKETRPGLSSDQVHQVVSNFFEINPRNRMAYRHHSSGETSRRPYKALHELTMTV